MTRLDGEKPKEDDWCRQGSFGNYVYSKGCYEKLKHKIESNTKVLIGVGIGIAFIEVRVLCYVSFLTKRIF